MRLSLKIEEVLYNLDDNEKIVQITQKKEILWHSSQVTSGDRQELLGHQPLVLWFTGLSGAGKSTLAFALERLLLGNGLNCSVLDGDNVRHGLNRDLGFSPGDRTENIRRVAEVARLMNDAGLIVIASFISPYHEDREMAKVIISSKRFVEVYLSASLDACEQRDTKGLYKKARRGELPGFTGISSPYEPPEDASLTLDTTVLSVDSCLELLLSEVLERCKLPELQ